MKIKWLDEPQKHDYPAAALSILVALAAAEYRTHAQNAAHVSSMFPSASARMPSPVSGV